MPTPVLVSTSSGGNNITTGGTATITAPSTISANNIIVAELTGTGTMTLPSGFSIYQTIPAANGAPQMVIASKVASGSEPSTYAFTSSSPSDTLLVSLLNISGANTSSPFNGYTVTNPTTPAAAVSTGSVTPSALNCLPLAFFAISQLSPSNTGNPTALSTGWTAEFTNVLQDGSSPPASYAGVSNGNGYAATFVAIGPLTSSTSAGVSASCTWGGAYSNFSSNSVILLINPLVFGTLAASPSSPTINGTGTANAVQITLTESGYSGAFSISVPTPYQGIVSVSSTQTGTYGTTASVNGPTGTFWVQELGTGNFQINVLGG